VATDQDRLVRVTETTAPPNCLLLRSADPHYADSDVELHHPVDAMSTRPADSVLGQKASIATEMSEEWVEIAPAQRRSTGELAYQRWLDMHGLTNEQLRHDLRQAIGRMVGGGDFVQYWIRASRLAQLGLTPEADGSTD
jgi:hypothetical protein